MPTFALLSKPESYIPCSTENMLEDHEYRNYWLNHFESHFAVIIKLAMENYGESCEQNITACAADLIAVLHQLRHTPDLFGKLDLLTLDLLRQQKLIQHNIPDPFESTKARENAAMLPLYPQVVAELDRHHDPAEALLLAIEGVFAGNIFDLGAAATAKMFANSSPDFLRVRNDLNGKRPWLVDDYDAMAKRILAGPTHKQALFFTDNAGSDFVLGVLPFCRLLANRGTRVVIAANHLPALNDITHSELAALLPQIQAIDPILDKLVRADRIATIDSGGTAPLIDLRQISAAVNQEAAATDLVILEGMGRALESNFAARFKVDAIKLCMIKEQIVADRHAGKLFDTICRFDPTS